MGKHFSNSKIEKKIKFVICFMLNIVVCNKTSVHVIKEAVFLWKCSIERKLPCWALKLDMNYEDLKTGDSVEYEPWFFKISVRLLIYILKFEFSSNV